MEFQIKKGYVPAPKPVKKRKYPFDQVKEGDYIDPPFPMEELNRVKFAMQKFNKANLGRLSIRKFPQGTESHPFPHFLVGWAPGAELRLYKERQRKKHKKTSRLTRIVAPRPDPNL